MTTLWAFSHESHNDPRIFNNLAMLRSHGWTTLYFDPPYPLHSQLRGSTLIEPRISLLQAPNVNEISEADLNSRTVAFLSEIKGLSYKERKPRLPAFAQHDNIQYSFKDSFQSSICVFSEAGTEKRYVYDFMCGKIYLLGVKGNSLEDDVLKLLVEARQQGGVRNVDHLIYSLNERHPGAYIERDGDTILVEMRPGFEEGLRLKIDIVSLTVTKQILPRRHSTGQDHLGGKYYSYNRFKKQVYDYTGVLGVIREYCERSDMIPPDVVLVSDLPTLPIGIMLKEHFGAQLIVDCHEWWSEQERVWNANELEKIQYIDDMERELYSLCDMRWTVSDTLAARMSEHYGVGFDYLPTCVFNEDNPHQGRSRRFWVDEAGLPFDARVVIFQGGLTTERNLDGLMRATRYLGPNQYLVVVGDGVYRETMEQILQEEGNPQQVRFLGWKPQELLWLYTVNADLGVIPYTHDLYYYQVSSPNKLAEYHSCRLPFIVDERMIELSRIVNADGVGVTVDCRDAAKLGATIRALLAEPARLAALRNAYSDDKERFGYDVIEKRMSLLADRLDRERRADRK